MVQSESLASCVSFVEKNPICKRKKLKRTAVQEFVVQIYLVARGVRRSYLVDCFSLDACTLVEVLKLTLSTLSMSDTPLVVVQLPTDDFFVLAPAVFARSIELRGLLDRVLLVDISGDGNPRDMLPSEVLPVAAHLTSLLQEIMGACHEALAAASPHMHLLPLAPDTAIIGYECLAGWLLGYSCVYNCATCREDSSSRYRQSLSLLPLVQKSITVQVQLGGGMHSATVQEFTVPLCVFREGEKEDDDVVSSPDSRSVNSNHFPGLSAQQFDAVMRREFDEVKAACLGDPFLSSVALDSTEVSYSSLAF